MKKNMLKCIGVLVSLVLAIGALTVPVAAVDETINANTDLSTVYQVINESYPTGRKIPFDYSLTAFRADLQAAIQQGRGGVFDFENPPSTLYTSPYVKTLNIKYGSSNEKTLPMTKNDNWRAQEGYNHPTNPVSGGSIPSSGYWAGVRRSSAVDRIITFGEIEGVEQSEYVTAFGLVAVATKSNAYGDAKLVATLNDGNTITAAARVNRGDQSEITNVFLGCKAPVGKYITQVQYNFISRTGSPVWTGFDDVGFITSVLGEDNAVPGTPKPSVSISTGYPKEAFEADLTKCNENYKGMFDFEDSTKYQINSDLSGFTYSYGQGKTATFTTSWQCDVYSGFVERTPTSGTKALLCGTPPSDNQWFAATEYKDNILTVNAEEPVVAMGFHLLSRALGSGGVDNLRTYKAKVIYNDDTEEPFITFIMPNTSDESRFVSWRAPEGKSIKSVVVNMMGFTSIDDIWIITADSYFVDADGDPVGDLSEYSGELKGCFSYTNSTENPETVMLIMARYQDDVLTGIAYSDPIEVAAGGTEPLETDIITIDEQDKGGIFKLFVWNGLSSIKPMAKPLTKETFYVE